MYIFLGLIILLIFLAIFIYINYKVICVSKYKIEDKKIPESFNNFKMLHISDWHCTMYGKDNKRLINLINKQNADIIVATGDFIVRQKKEYEPVIDFFKQIKTRPIYFSLGNHDLTLREINKLDDFLNKLESIGVTVLNDKKAVYIKENEKINIYGMNYNSDRTISRKMYNEELANQYAKIYKEKLGTLDTNEYNILLTHDPLNFKSYAKLGFDLVYAGHVHGGGIRLFGWGVATTRKNWWFTKLAAGLSKLDNTKMIVSRGVGNSTIPIRLFDLPEISVTTLSHISEE